ncbi:MAG: alpha-galactosidase [Thermoleophilaceae bacterium]|nr:alpha-galactosidase [Thermoleophilaceae bacterium]
MKRLALAVAALLALPSAAAADTVRSGSARATAGDGVAALTNGSITRTWRTGPAGVVTASLRQGRRGTEWSNGASPDFKLELAGVPTSSTSGWTLRSVTARREPADPARPDRSHGVQLVFRYALDPAGLIALERTYTLRSGASIIGVTSVLHNGSPAPLRVGAYSLDELTSPKLTAGATVLTYHGGSDWRDDYRVATKRVGPFDDEGEVARFDDGTGAGWFFVSERRSGTPSRVGRDAAGRTFAGFDASHDILDAGPLMSAPPNYNRVDNPLYPVPVRGRTVAPLGTLRLGRAYMGVYKGGEQGAAAAFVTDFARNEMPRFNRSVGINTFHPWSHSPDLSDNPKLRAQVDIAKALGLESFMIDDQWQGGAGGESGDWRWDADTTDGDVARFPDTDKNGKPDFVDYIHSQGLRLALWMSPLEFHTNSQTYKAHPDWACTPTGHITGQVPDDAGLGVWDATNPAFQDYMSGVIDRLVKDYDVREFKFDFMAWVDCPPRDYLDYEDAFVALVRRFQANHPGITFELDETNDQRSWPFESAALGASWFDNAHSHPGSTKQSKLLHDIWTAAPWLPPSSIGFGTYDDTLAAPYTVDYLFPMSMLSHITFWTDLRKLTPPQRDATSWWIAWYKAHRAELSGLVYENTESDPLDGKGWAAFQPWAAGHGYVFAFRQADGPDTKVIKLHGVSPKRDYVVKNVRTGETVGTFSGSELAEAGLPVTLENPFSAAVLSVTPAKI